MTFSSAVIPLVVERATPFVPPLFHDLLADLLLDLRLETADPYLQFPSHHTEVVYREEEEEPDPSEIACQLGAAPVPAL